MESRAVNLALGGPPDAALRDVASRRGSATCCRGPRSRLALRRSAFQALRKLLTFLAYAEPGADGARTRCSPRSATSRTGRRSRPTSTPIAPLALPGATRTAVRGRSSLDADVVVVGSGAGGGVVAAELAAAGRSVVVLEAGPFVDEVDAADATSSTRSTGCTWTTASSSTWDGSVTILAGSAVGGGTLVNWMTTHRRPGGRPRRVGRATTGLEGVEDGAAWSEDVAAVEADLGVAESTRIPPKDAILLRGARALGWEAAPTRRDADGLRRLRELRVRLPSRDQAVAGSASTSPAPPRPAPGSCPTLRSRASWSSRAGPPAWRRCSATAAGSRSAPARRRSWPRARCGRPRSCSGRRSAIP